MKLRLNNDGDVAAAAIVAGLQNYRSIAALIAEYILLFCPPDDDFEIIIDRDLVSDSYKSNPSALALVIVSKISHEFKDSAGYQTPGTANKITLLLMREEKPTHQRRTRSKPSIKSLIKEFLDANEDKDTILELPFNVIPPFIFSHPEHLSYQINRETQIRIKITRNKTNWHITRQ